MKAMPRSTTWQPMTPQTIEDMTATASAFGRKARSGLNRSVRKSWIDSQSTFRSVSRGLVSLTPKARIHVSSSRRSDGAPSAMTVRLSRTIREQVCTALDEVVGGHQHGVTFGGEVGEEVGEELLGRAVEAGEGLVEQQHRRREGEGPGHEDALALPTRQLADRALPEVGQVDAIERLADRRPVPAPRAVGPGRSVRCDR